VIVPYTIERRPDTGMTNVTLGMWLFIASEIMLFGALFSAWALLRASAPAWPSGQDVLSVQMGVTNTLVLTTMTALMWRARRAMPRSARQLLALGSLLALVFLAVKSVEWTGEILTGLVPARSTFLAMYYTLTGLHALHVVAGLAANAWVIAGARRIADPRLPGRIRALSLYWAFVDVVWLVIFVLVYLS
jgi:heme/copper-type cytochrome/quinol oxidase subunit 3